MYHDLDTIAAIATAPGEAGIAVVRVSGSAAFQVADATVSCSGPPPSERQAETFFYAKIRFPLSDDPHTVAGSHIDEAIVLLYRSPRSYTGEHVVEIQCHGGRASAARVLRAVLQCGARLAEPGEFTRRAFLNGRIDLLQAEAVADLIRARSDRAASAAVDQMEGSLSHSCKSLYDSAISIAADMEASLDFEADELPAGVLNDVLARLGNCLHSLIDMLSGWEEGHLLREGVLVVISGQPNVGKSTLMNRLLGKDRAIVTDTPGTTRDFIEELFICDGIPVRLVDTAGLRESDCNIEREGVRRARDHIMRADVNIHVVDASRPIDDDENGRLARLMPGRSLIALNKTDVRRQGDHPPFPRDIPVLECAFLHGTGVLELRTALTTLIHSPRVGTGLPSAVISERHRDVLQRTHDLVRESRDLLWEGNEENVVLAAASLRQAIEILGTATGRVYSDELLDAVFSRFCVGK